MNSQLAVTEASQRRLFFEQQVTAEKAELQHSEDELRATQEKTGVIQLAGQSEAIIRAISTQQAEIASREVELKSMETFATDQNPQMAMRRQEIAAMKEQLAKMENSQGQTGGGDILVPSGKVPAAGLEYSRKLRDFKFHESLFELLTRQYEAARIDEAKSAPLIQVVDRAVPPQKMSAPARTLIVIGGFLLGIAASIGLRFAQIGARNMMSDPARADKVRAIASAFRSGQQSAAAENAR